MNNRHRLVEKLQKRKVHLEAKEIIEMYRPAMLNPAAMIFWMLYQNSKLKHDRKILKTLQLQSLEVYEKYKQRVTEAFSEE